MTTDLDQLLHTQNVQHNLRLCAISAGRTLFGVEYAGMQIIQLEDALRTLNSENQALVEEKDKALAKPIDTKRDLRRPSS